jgi:short-subunit dehydrogenase
MKALPYKHDRFSQRYGAWALVLGASEGLGAAFARVLSDRGMNLVLVARRNDLLEKVAADCRLQFGVEARCLAMDLAASGFAEKLRDAVSELEERGIDVVACCAGAIHTPGYMSSAGRDAPGTLDPEIVADRAIRALGRGPIVVPGLVNRLAAWVMGRLLPRRTAIRIMADSTRDLARTPKARELS